MFWPRDLISPTPAWPMVRDPQSGSLKGNGMLPIPALEASQQEDNGFLDPVLLQLHLPQWPPSMAIYQLPSFGTGVQEPSELPETRPVQRYVKGPLECYAWGLTLWTLCPSSLLVLSFLLFLLTGAMDFISLKAVLNGCFKKRVTLLESSIQACLEHFLCTPFSDSSPPPMTKSSHYQFCSCSGLYFKRGVGKAK